jgi:hypothetical protein
MGQADPRRRPQPSCSLFTVVRKVSTSTMGWFLICKGTTRQTRMGISTDTSWHVSGGARSQANAFRMTKKVDDVVSRAPSAESTPSLISVLGLRSLRARRRHDDRWADLALNMDAAAQSFRAVQLEEGTSVGGSGNRTGAGRSPVAVLYLIASFGLR